MNSGVFRIVKLKRSHIPALNQIVASSEPWKRLGEGIDFHSAASARFCPVLTYVCTSAARPVGFVMFSPWPVFARGGYLRAIAVAPAFRGYGIGRKLLEFTEGMTSKRAGNLYLCVSSFNRSAQAFYKKCGYVRVGSIPGLVNPSVSEYIYWKRLIKKNTHPSGVRYYHQDKA